MGAECKKGGLWVRQQLLCDTLLCVDGCAESLEILVVTTPSLREPKQGA